MTDTTTTNYGWIMPGDHVNTNTWGALLNSDIQGIDTVVHANQQAIAALNQGFFTSNRVVLNKATVPLGNLIYGNLNGVGRWAIDLGDGTAETGGNQGSNFTITNFSDAGAVLSIPLSINRATGATTITGSLSVTNGVSVTGTTAITGSLSVTNGVSVTGAVSITGNFYGGTTLFPAYASAPNWYMTQTSTDQVQNHAASWADAWNLTTGTRVWTGPAGNLMSLDGAGNFIIMGTATKPGGGSWNSPSDARIKTVVGDYAPGLNEVLQLRPVVYRYKGNDSSKLDEPSPQSEVAKSGKQFVGFVAQELEQIIPEMVSQREAYIDGQKVQDLRNVDTSALVYALVNAVQALKLEIETLKAARP